MIIYSKLKERLILWNHKRNQLNNKCILLRRFLMIKSIEEMKIRNYWMRENQNV